MKGHADEEEIMVLLKLKAVLSLTEKLLIWNESSLFYRCFKAVQLIPLFFFVCWISHVAQTLLQLYFKGLKRAIKNHL